MINKKAEISVPQLIALILVVLVVVVVLISIFSPRLWDFVRALPDYKYNDTDRVIEYNPLTDLNVEGVCPDASKIGFVGELRGDIGFREQYINFFIDDKTALTSKFYWKGGERDGKIWWFQKDKYAEWDWFKSDLLVASVNEEGVIKVEPNFLDLNSEIYQKTRFEIQVLEFSFLPRLENAYLAFNNQICRIAELAEFKPAWPESQGKKLNLIKPKISIEKNTFFADQYKIDLSPYLIPKAPIFLYVVDRGSFIEIKGDVTGIDYVELGRIYPDGSVWIDQERMKIKRSGSELVKINFKEEFFGRYNFDYKPFYETNLRLENYNLIKNIIR